MLAVVFMGAGPAAIEPDRSGSDLSDLRPNTAEAYRRYLAGAAEVAADRASGRRTFLWLDEAPDRVERVRRGETIVVPTTGNPLAEVPEGLVHDWTGAVFVPGATLDRTLALLRDYDNHEKYVRAGGHGVGRSSRAMGTTSSSSCGS